MEPDRKCGAAARKEAAPEMKLGQHSFSEKQEVKPYVGNTLKPEVIQTSQRAVPHRKAPDVPAAPSPAQKGSRRPSAQHRTERLQTYKCRAPHRRAPEIPAPSTTQKGSRHTSARHRTEGLQTKPAPSSAQKDSSNTSTQSHTSYMSGIRPSCLMNLSLGEK